MAARDGAAMTDQEQLAKRLEAAERFIEGLREWQMGSGEQSFYQRLRNYDAAIAALESPLLEVAKELSRQLDDGTFVPRELAQRFRAAIEHEEAKQR